MTAEDGGKSAGIIAYITLFGFLISLLAMHKKGQEQSAFHLRQSLGIFLFASLSFVLNFIPVVGPILLLVLMICVLISWISGLIGAIKGTQKPVFFFGKQFQKWFAGIQ